MPDGVMVVRVVCADVVGGDADGVCFLWGSEFMLLVGVLC